MAWQCLPKVGGLKCKKVESSIQFVIQAKLTWEPTNRSYFSRISSLVRCPSPSTSDSNTKCWEIKGMNHKIWRMWCLAIAITLASASLWSKSGGMIHAYKESFGRTSYSNTNELMTQFHTSVHFKHSIHTLTSSKSIKPLPSVSLNWVNCSRSLATQSGSDGESRAEHK